MLQGSLSVLQNIQKMTCGFWDPKKSTTIFPCTERSLTVFLCLLQIAICFMYQVLENLKKYIILALLTGKEKEMLTLLCVLVEEERNSKYKKSR